MDDNPPQPTTQWEKTKAFIKKESTFFRVHIAAFVFVPLLVSIVFYFCNGRFQVSFLDSLFLCYSAMTVTGLSTVNLSTLTVFQQVLMYLLMIIGDITFISWIMVMVRKKYFQTHCEWAARKTPSLLTRSRTLFGLAISNPIEVTRLGEPAPNQPEPQDLKLEKPFNQEQTDLQSSQSATLEDDHDTNLLDDPLLQFTSSPQSIGGVPLSPGASSQRHVGFASALERKLTTIPESVPISRRGMTMLTARSVPQDNANTTNTNVPNFDDPRYSGFGVPHPLHIANRLVHRAVPRVHSALRRKLTIPLVRTYRSDVAGNDDASSESGIGDYLTAKWLEFSGLIVNRNSDFRTDTLTDEQLENIGGVEYKALRLLSYLVPAYFILTQAIPFLLFAPWLATTTRYNAVFTAQPRLVNKTWFSLFLVMGAYTGGGLSLVDMSMIPFQGAYLLVLAISFVILAGNHAMPIFLRFVIWVMSRIVRENSDHDKTLSFLLDHPRRCFVYLFPSHQTWFLTICLVAFSAVEWGAFELLNVGLPAFESIAEGPRVVAGLFQGLAARASGFSIVPVANMAPAVQFMYIVMMYIAVYPVALSIRSTNVYEERSLGVFELPEEDEDEEPSKADMDKLDRRQRVGRYFGWHLRRQVAQDIWWIVWAVLFIAIIERKNLLDENMKWFDMFRVIFELVSAFGGIGLSLGVPYDNFSFSGGLKPMSKIVIIVIMVRGRHRGLPVAIDRAILLPSELVTSNNNNNTAAPSQPAKRQTTSVSIPGTSNELGSALLNPA